MHSTQEALDCALHKSTTDIHIVTCCETDVSYTDICSLCTGVCGELFTSDGRSTLVAHGHLCRRSFLGLGAEGAACQTLRHLLDHQRHVGGLRGEGLVLCVVDVVVGGLRGEGLVLGRVDVVAGGL